MRLFDVFKLKKIETIEEEDEVELTEAEKKLAAEIEL